MRDTRCVCSTATTNYHRLRISIEPAPEELADRPGASTGIHGAVTADNIEGGFSDDNIEV